MSALNEWIDDKQKDRRLAASVGSCMDGWIEKWMGR